MTSTEIDWDAKLAAGQAAAITDVISWLQTQVKRMPGPHTLPGSLPPASE